ncbi:MAG: MarR family transcriptional regulator [Lachnospiraceae bacterium]|nr:MarR family transcriptional regulator [Lachnospiraceae bacterium]
MVQILNAIEATELKMCGKPVFAVTEEALRKASKDAGAFDFESIVRGELLMFTTDEDIKLPAPEKKGEVPAEAGTGQTEEMPAGTLTVYAGGYVSELAAMYRAGKSMEEIAEILNMSLQDVSRVVKKLGLGEERYRGKVIPSSGSVPIKSGFVGR